MKKRAGLSAKESKTVARRVRAFLQGRNPPVTVHGWDVYKPVCCGLPVEMKVSPSADGRNELVHYRCSRCHRWAYERRKIKTPPEEEVQDDR